MIDSSLLIPMGLKPVFDKQVLFFGGTSKLFTYVVNSQHPVFRACPKTGTGRTIYAPEGLNLQKINFKPNNEDWEKFRLIAQSLRISMSFLFVLVLLNWNEIFANQNGVPAKPIKIAITTSLTIGPIFTRIHLCRFRI